jgi:hypothetical protein
MAKAQSYVFDGPEMGPEHGVYVGGREYRLGDVIAAEQIATPEDARNIEQLLARGVLRKVSATKPAKGEEV